MKQIINLAVFVGVVSVSVPFVLQKTNLAENFGQQEVAFSNQPSAETQNIQSKKKAKSHNPLEGRVERLDASRGGHFFAKARMNGRPIQVMVDTGATSIAMNEHVAKRIGVSLKPADFKYKSRTANGIAKIASVQLKEVQIGRIIVHDVQAVVTKGNKLDSVLLGMSFLNRLKKFEVENGTLILRQ